MRMKNYIILVVIAVLSVSMFVLVRPLAATIDAITRPSDDTAVLLLTGIKNVIVVSNVHHHGDKSDYEDFSKIDWYKGIVYQLQKNGLKIANLEPADGMVVLDIHLATNKETEFVAVNLRLSFLEELKMKRIPLKTLSEWSHPCITWQSSHTLMLHRNNLDIEVRKRVQNMVWHFCRIYREAIGANRYERFLKESEKQHETPVKKKP